MYETMTTYMLPESPESSSHIPSHHASNSASLIGSPRSTPTLSNGNLKPNGSAGRDPSVLWNGSFSLLHQQQQLQQQQQQQPQQQPLPAHATYGQSLSQQQLDDENQSVRSDNSLSLRSRKPVAGLNGKSHGRGNVSHRSHRSVRTVNREMAPSPLQTAAVLASSMNGSGSSGSDRANAHQEVIEVQILPQDDGWGDNATAITGNTSVASGSMDDMSRVGTEQQGRGEMSFDPNWAATSSAQLGWAFRCQRYVGSVAAALLALFAFATPMAMVLLPRLRIIPLRSEQQYQCSAECEGLLISLTVKLILLALGTWAVFWRPTRATMPRIFFLRSLVLLLVFVTTFAYCLFYGVRVVEQQDQLDYKAIVMFALSLVDALLFVHYAAVLLLEIRQLPPRYYIHVVRSPDGVSRGYALGAISIQRAAVWLLDKYYADFPIYNPYLERLPPRRARSKLHNSSSFKFYDIDAQNPGALQKPSGRSLLSSSSRRNNSSHNERFYEEHEYERRLKKRRARLVTAAEEAFTHIRRLQVEQGPAVPMDPYEAAQAIFPSMARPLQKYLRITRQQPRHSVESILQHLAICLSHDMSARAFTEKFLVSSPVMQNDKEKMAIQTWSLVCDVLLSRGIEDGTVFQLRQNDVSLLCRVSSLPHFNITEEIIEPKSNKFVLRLSSETSV